MKDLKGFFREVSDRYEPETVLKKDTKKPSLFWSGDQTKLISKKFTKLISKKFTFIIESLILAQDERWRRA